MEEKKLQKFIHKGHCPVRDVLARLGDKWSVLVIVSLRTNGRLRFSDIQRTIGDVSQRMLTVTLRSLESDGLIRREVFAEVPPRVEYELTDRGLSLCPHLKAIIGWAEEHMGEIITNRNGTLEK